MAKKKIHSNDNEKQNDSGNVTVVLKTDLHCEGCAKKVVKAIRSLSGVEKVKIGDNELKKITVIGKFDPDKLRGTVEEKIKKKVELLSPVTKKQNDGGDGEHKTQVVVVKDESKPKKIAVTTVVLKVPLHCHGCIDKIKKLVRKTEGFVEMSIDKSKDLVTVKGGMDVKVLKTTLEDGGKRKVEIVQPKDTGKRDDGGKKGKGGGGGKKGKGRGGVGDGEGKESIGDERGVEVHKMEYFPGQGQYTYPQYVNGPEYPFNYMHATQMFNDENPNACAIM